MSVLKIRLGEECRESQSPNLGGVEVPMRIS